MKNFTPYTLLILCLFLMGHSRTAIAQEQEIPATSPEEVVITGNRMLFQLRVQMLDAEKQAYDIFNRYNDEKRFMIECSWQTRTGSHMREQTCFPKFQLDAYEAHARVVLANYRDLLDPYTIEGTTQTVRVPMEAVIAVQQPDYKRKLEQVANEHPEFLQAIIEYTELKQQYEAATRTTFGKDRP